MKRALAVLGLLTLTLLSMSTIAIRPAFAACAMCTAEGGGDGHKAASTCDAAEGLTFTSQQTAPQIFQLVGNDDLAALAIWVLERNAREGRLSDVGAFPFALPRSEAERRRALNGQSLEFTPFGVETTGFADYAASFSNDGNLDITMRVWRVATATQQPIDGVHLLVNYRLVNRALVVQSVEVLRAMPVPEASYFGKRTRVERAG